MGAGVVSTYIKNNILGSLSMADGTGTPVTLAITVDRGDLTIGGLSAKLNELVKIRRRGNRASEAYGERKDVPVSFSIYVGNLAAYAATAATAPGSVLEFLTKTGVYSANVSTSGAGAARPYTVDLTFTIEGTDVGDTADETVLLNDFIATSCDFAESIDGNTITVTGECLGSVVISSGDNVATFAEV